MIFYRGQGFWSPFIPFFFFIIVRGIQEDRLGIHGWRWWSGALSLLMGGALVWSWGVSLNGPLD
jgi:asparagine N-glycosylation enzyme membrane subunit Stt3